MSHSRSMSAYLPLLIFALAGCAMPRPVSTTAPLLAAETANLGGRGQESAIRLPTPTPEAPEAAGAMAESGPTPEQAALLTGLRNWGPAPELRNDTWFNSPPLKLADLRGKVVMVEFWTYGCINCQHVIPALQEWHAAYAEEGLVIIGVHTPEFRHEADPANVEAAIERLGVAWPVAVDNEKETWHAYANRFWPAMYLIDKQGNLRYVKIGEGQYDHTRAIIEALLAEPA